MSALPELDKLLRTSAIDALLPAAALPKDETAPRQTATALSAPQTGRTDISDTGQLLDRLLRLATQASPVTTSTTKLLLATPDAKPAQLASALHDAFSTSGLFYESHLASWVTGQHSCAALALEPQGQIAAGTGSEEGSLPQLVKAQLDAMEKREMQWQGQVSPGVPTTLSVQAPHDGDKAAPHPSDNDPPQWQTRMQLALPALGNIQARLQLTGGHLQLNLHAHDNATVALLRAHLSKLSAALADSGTVLQQCSVSLGHAHEQP